MTTPDIPSRPSVHDRACCDEIAEELLDSVIIWLNESNEARGEIAEQLSRAIHASSSDDAYHIAKKLDDMFGWDPDENLLDILEATYSIRSKVEARRVSKWVEDNNLNIQKFPVGALVKFKEKFSGKVFDGEVTSFNEKVSRYTVFCESAGHVRTGAGARGFIVNSENLESKG